MDPKRNCQFVHPSVCPPICLSVHLSICPSVRPLSIHWYICQSVHLFIPPSIHPFVHPFTHPFVVHPFVHLFIHSFVHCPSVCLSVCLFIAHPFVHLFVCSLSIRLFVCSFVSQAGRGSECLRITWIWKNSPISSRITLAFSWDSWSLIPTCGSTWSTLKMFSEKPILILIYLL